MGMLSNPAADLVRKDKNFESLGLDANNYTTREAVLDLLLQHQVLMQRPIIVRGQKAVIARPSEKVLELLD
jgi:arsenate reductase (glutaredoxin)